MSKLLVLIADPFSSSRSASKNVATTFIRQYIEEHPKDEIRVLNLCNDPFPRVDPIVLDAWDKELDGVAFEELPLVQQEKIREINDLSTEFLTSDKFLIVAPTWNLLTPPELQEYFFSVLRLGSRYTLDESLLKQVMNGAEKKVLLILSSFHEADKAGAPFHSLAEEWLKSIYSLCGVSDFESIYVQGCGDTPEKREEILKNANVDAKIYATTF